MAANNNKAYMYDLLELRSRFRKNQNILSYKDKEEFIQSARLSGPFLDDFDKAIENLKNTKFMNKLIYSFISGGYESNFAEALLLLKIPTYNIDLSREKAYVLGQKLEKDKER